MEQENMEQISDRDILEYLKNMVAIKSENPPGNERAVAEYVAGELRRWGISAKIQEVETGRANVLAKTGPRDGRPIILNGHLDVVPAGEGWNTEPYQMVCRDGRCFGRGTSDMKGGLAAMLGAFLRIHQKNILESTCLILAFTCDEEVDGKGTRCFLEEYHPRKDTRVIIGEPTSTEIQIAHRGVIRLQLKVYGKQAHSAFPEQGCNAVTALGRLLSGVEQYHVGRQKLCNPLLPPPTVSCTMIRGGVKDNVIPPAAECILDCRTIPGDTPDKLMRELSEILDGVPLPEGTRYELSWFIEMPPGITEPTCGTVSLARQAFREEMGREAPVKDFPACSDMPQFTGRGLETVIWGPGEISQAHVVNESLEIGQLYQMAKLYERFVLLSDKEGI